MVNKLIVDGKVAVIYKPGLGLGWYTDHGIEDLLFDEKLAKLILLANFQQNRHEQTRDENIHKQVLQYMKEVEDRAYTFSCYGRDIQFKIISDTYLYSLYIKWIPVDKKIFLTQYDGAETIHVEDKVPWINV